MDAETLDRAWDPSAPGAGALRATAITQLYFRMTSHHALTILVVDALCLVFGADGVTVQELVDYLGITEDRIRFGLEGIPPGMRSTSLELEAEGTSTGPSSAAADPNGGAQSLSSVGGRRLEVEVRYYLNYKRLLPLVYAHVTRLLLSACVVDVPPCSYVAAVKAAALAPYRRSTEATTAHALFAGAPPSDAAPRAGMPSVLPYTDVDGTGEHIDVSDAMKRANAIRGVYCLGCSCYLLVEEFDVTLSRCPRCGKDSLRLCIQSIQRLLDARLAEQHTVVKLLPAVSQMWKRHLPTLLAARKPLDTAPVEEGVTSGASGRAIPSEASKAAAGSAPTPQKLSCDLASDPFLLQQALAFLFLYTSRFASVNDAASVVDVQQILTEPEYRERLRGKASLADQFRSRHRHATSVHVRLVSQKDVDAARREESHQKLLKRAMLPPWLRYTSALEALGGSHVYSRGSSAHIAAQKSRVDAEGTEEATVGVAAAAEPAVREPWESEEVKTSDQPREHVLHSGALWRQAKASPTTVADKRPRATEADVKMELTRAANFIATRFYDDEYDEVPLPLSRVRRQ